MFAVTVALQARVVIYDKFSYTFMQAARRCIHLQGWGGETVQCRNSCRWQADRRHAGDGQIAKHSSSMRYRFAIHNVLRPRARLKQLPCPTHPMCTLFLTTAAAPTLADRQVSMVDGPSFDMLEEVARRVGVCPATLSALMSISHMHPMHSNSLCSAGTWQ